MYKKQNFTVMSELVFNAKNMFLFKNLYNNMSTFINYFHINQFFMIKQHYLYKILSPNIIQILYK